MHIEFIPHKSHMYAWILYLCTKYMCTNNTGLSAILIGDKGGYAVNVDINYYQYHDKSGILTPRGIYVWPSCAHDPMD